MKKIFYIILGLLLIIGCNQAQNKVPQGGKPTVPQVVELSSDKSVYLLGEDVMLNVKISSPRMELSITGVNLELYDGFSDSIEWYDKSRSVPFDGKFEVEGDLGWTGTVTISPDKSQELSYKLKTLKEGKYSIATLVNSEIGGNKEMGKREIVEVCVVSDLSKSEEFCAKKSISGPEVEATRIS